MFSFINYLKVAQTSIDESGHTGTFLNGTFPYGCLTSFSIKNVFYDKMDLTAFLFSCDDVTP